VIIEKEGLGAAFTLVVTGSYADGVDVAPVVFLLRMNSGISVDLTGGGLQDSGVNSFCQPQHVDGAHDAGLDCLYRVVLIVVGRGGAGQIVYLVHFEEYGLHQIVTYQFKVGFSKEMAHVLFSTGEEIVQTQNIVALHNQTITEMRA